jgi:hypothetical protein
MHKTAGTINDKVKLYASSCRLLFPNLVLWDYNRPLDETHKLKLKQIIIDNNYLEGSFDIIKCDDKMAIVNGQHRYAAIIDIMKDNTLFDMDIICNVHIVSDFDSEEATNIFLATNNIKNVKLSDNPDKKLMNVCHKLMLKFPDGIKSNKSGKANLHRIDIKELYNTMQMNDIFTDENKTEEDVYDIIMKLNSDYSLKPYQYYFGSSELHKNIKLYEGAGKCGFYMGLIKGSRLKSLIKNFKK